MLTSKWEQSNPTRTRKPAGLFIIIFYIIVLQIIDLWHLGLLETAAALHFSWGELVLLSASVLWRKGQFLTHILPFMPLFAFAAASGGSWPTSAALLLTPLPIPFPLTSVPIPQGMLPSHRSCLLHVVHLNPPRPWMEGEVLHISPSSPLSQILKTKCSERPGSLGGPNSGCLWGRAKDAPTLAFQRASWCDVPVLEVSWVKAHVTAGHPALPRCPLLLLNSFNRR